MKTSAILAKPRIPAPENISEPWRSFTKGAWTDEINVRDFIVKNVTPYDHDEAFLTGPTERTRKLSTKLAVLLKKEIDNGGVLDADETVVGTISSHGAGYIDSDLEQIVGLQTDAPLKPAMLPYGGRRIANQALIAHGKKMDP